MRRPGREPGRREYRVRLLRCVGGAGPLAAGPAFAHTGGRRSPPLCFSAAGGDATKPQSRKGWLNMYLIDQHYITM